MLFDSFYKIFFTFNYFIAIAINIHQLMYCIWLLHCLNDFACCLNENDFMGHFTRCSCAPNMFELSRHPHGVGFRRRALLFRLWCYPTTPGPFLQFTLALSLFCAFHLRIWLFLLNKIFLWIKIETSEVDLRNIKHGRRLYKPLKKKSNLATVTIYHFIMSENAIFYFAFKSKYLFNGALWILL